jgi:hypothetical protein
MTCDHILTLTTCIEKYVNVSKKRLYSCFVDYAKAFDTVCREALLYKLWKIGIQGKFFNCLKHMYTNSSAKVKLLNKLSEKIDVLCGTEQGHPMSPELFKCFVHQLSEDLNQTDKAIEAPLLNSERITHLLWADDLVLLALNPESLQRMLNVLHSYCTEWGLSVNLGKTAVMVFNRSGRLLKESSSFFYGENPIVSARDYTYLGITFTLSGSLKTAQTSLRQKAMRSYFSLKSMVDMNHLKKAIVFKLFDALILPVAAYGSQIWLPYTTAMRSLAQGFNPTLTKISQDPLEKVHLSFLKWTLGVGKYTSNAAVWGDTGRYPLAFELMQQAFSYFQRIQQLDTDNSSAFVRHAFAEQRALSLTWFTNLTKILSNLGDLTGQQPNNAAEAKEAVKSLFTTQWDSERRNNRKLRFYNLVKDSFGQENYINIDLSYLQSKRLAQIRASSHRLNVETGRHGCAKQSSILNRVCPHCCNVETLAYIAPLPLFEPIIEDEKHVLRECPYYEDLRDSLNDTMKECLINDHLVPLFTDRSLIRDMAKFLLKIHRRRFSSKDTADNKEIE